MAVLGGRADNAAAGRKLCEACLASGKPRELFLANVASQGGDPAKLLELRGRWRSPVTAELRARPGSGKAYITKIDAFKVGHAAVSLGVGRSRTGDTVSPTAGIRFHQKSGGPVRDGDGLMTVWAASEEGLAAALPRLEEAVEYGAAPPAARTLVLKEISPTQPRADQSAQSNSGAGNA
jgi:pyrimidine-nucleoside phosphorylase